MAEGEGMGGGLKGLFQDKRKAAVVLGGGLVIGYLWYRKKQATAASTTGTSAAATDSGSVDTGPTGGAADSGYPYGGFGDSTGGFGGTPGNYSGLPPVTISSAGSNPPSPSKRTITVGKGESQKEIIEAAGESYKQFLADNPSLAKKGSKVHTGQKVVVR